MMCAIVDCACASCAFIRAIWTVSSVITDLGELNASLAVGAEITTRVQGAVSRRNMRLAMLFVAVVLTVTLAVAGPFAGDAMSVGAPETIADDVLGAA